MHEAWPSWDWSWPEPANSWPQDWPRGPEHDWWHGYEAWPLGEPWWADEDYGHHEIWGQAEACPEDWPQTEAEGYEDPDWPAAEREGPPQELGEDEEIDGDTLSEPDEEEAEELDRKMVANMCRYLVENHQPGDPQDTQHLKDHASWGCGVGRGLTNINVFRRC